MIDYTPEQIEDYVERTLEVLRKDNKGNIYTVCPSCGDNSQRFSVNIYKGIFNCWKDSSHFKGKFGPKLFKVAGPFDAGYDFVKKSSKSQQKPNEELDPNVYSIIYNHHFRPIDELEWEDMFYWERECEKRHFSIQKLKELGIKVSYSYSDFDKEYGTSRNYFMIPYFDENKFPIYFQYRSIKPDSQIKWKFPKEIGDYFKTNFIYRVDPINKYDTLIICESIFDAIRVGNPCIALGGSSLSPVQINLIREYGAKKILVLLDGDHAGGKGTAKVVKELSSYLFTPIFFPSLEYFKIDKDPDELSQEELVQVIKSCGKNSKLDLFREYLKDF